MADIVRTRIREQIRHSELRINKSWVEAQNSVAMENPVDRAPMYGKPTMAEFGASGCVPCDMMQTILDKLRKKFPGRLNVVFVHVREKPIMGSRFGIRSISVRVFFDNNGKEVFRHKGFMGETDIDRVFKKIGVS